MANPPLNLIRSSAERYHVPADLLASLLEAESSFNPGATSGAGAQGIAQFMPGTWSGSWNPYRAQSPLNQTAAIPAAALYLSRALQTNHGNVQLALASYNAGQGAVNQYHGIPPYQETQSYVKRILGYRSQFPGLATGNATGGTTPPAAAPPVNTGPAAPQSTAPTLISNPAYQQTLGIQNLIQQNAQNAKIPTLSLPLPAQTITQQAAPTATTNPPTGDTTVHLALPTPPHVTGHEAQVVQLARTYLGTPYQWGGTTPKGFDCSGFAQFLYKRIGVNLPRTSEQQFNVGKPVALNQLQPGDLVFFKGTDGPANDVGHEGIYIGGGRFIHAPHTGDVVKISNLGDAYYQQHFAGGRRVG